jgi:chondroitin AC lyase
MFSDRLWNTEEINAEGRKSHHLADGAMMLYLTGDEYRDIFPVWDWSKIPGTTAEQGELNTILPKGAHEKGKTDFVGGVSDGTYGLCAMDLERGALAAKKAWFFFDDVIVCLGAGITCTSDNPVVTTINQCHAKGSDAVQYAGARIQSATKPQTGRWSDFGSGSDQPVTLDVFTAWIEHGVRPQDATYEYRVMPGRKSQEIETLANEPNLQAVRCNDLGIIMAVFRAPGEIAGVRVDQPCLVMMRGESVCVSNPRNHPLVVNVTIGDRSLRFDLPSGPLAGSTISK